MTATAEKSRKTRERKPLTREEWLEKMTYGERQRLRFFETKLLWEGHVTRGDVGNQFGVTKNHFSREVSDYRRFYAANFEYDAWARGYRPTREFRPVFATGEPEEYLALLKVSATMPSASVIAQLGSLVPAAIPAEPGGKIDHDMLTAILRAIHGRVGVKVRYQSFSQEEPSNRTVWPHALLWSGDRWYVRGFDSQRNTYISLALQRLLEANTTHEPLPETAGVDSEWEDSEIIEVTPHPALSKSQQLAVAREYGMKQDKKGYVWCVNLRCCLIPYFLNRYRLDEAQSQRTRNGAPTQRIVVRNQEIVKKFAFPSD